MEENALLALTAFLESEKKIAEHQALTLADAMPGLKKRVRNWEAQFDSYREKPPRYIFHFCYSAIRLEGAKSDLHKTGQNLIYHAEAQKKISNALDSLPHGRFDEAAIALLHISTMRPIDKLNPFLDESSQLNNPRFVAGFFLDKLRECCRA